MNDFVRIVDDHTSGEFKVFFQSPKGEKEFQLPFENRFEFITVKDAILGHDYPIIKLSKYTPKLIMDVGAHLGESAIHFNGHFPNATILSFEPSSKNFDYAEQNLSHFENIHVFNYGLFNETKLEKIHIGSSQSACNSIFGNVFTGDDVEDIKLVDISDEIRSQNIDHIDILKLDTEGCEVQIIEKLMDEKSVSVDMIYLEYHSEEDRIELDQILKHDFILGYGVSGGFHRGLKLYFNKEWLKDYEDFDFQKIRK